ncbi:MAG: hypothetical protein IT361_01115 [Gemmatimonadaceae bacterium]|nr:hypothetical protein [Gemmatimonadaceae bacterium]
MTRHLVRWLRTAAAKLVVTTWLVYALFATTNVARETYLSLAVAERWSIRVDEYQGLHPDLFEMPGRGWYINNNPGTSFLGAIPYTLARPALSALYAWKPHLLAPKPPATYDDARPNRSKFLNASRARGLDVKLGLAALITGVGLMAPLGALAAWVLFRFLRARGMPERRAIGCGLLYALVTPIFFRSAFLNQNAILTHCVLGAYVLLAGWTPRPRGALPSARDIALAGALLGFGLLCDYGAVPLIVAFGVWVLALHVRRGVVAMLRAGATYTLGAVPMIVALFWYQAAAFGSPWFPAQRYMPATKYSVIGWNGFFVPTAELLTGNLFDPRYGLFVFCPLLAAALFAGFVRRDATDPDAGQLRGILGVSLALYLFSSANQFAMLQWNTGVRYLVPLAPLLFLAALPVLRAMPRPAAGLLVGTSVVISCVVSMTRESVPDALRLVAREGPTLPIFIVLEKVASGYPALQFGLVGPLVAFGGLALVLWLLWRRSSVAPEVRA